MANEILFKTGLQAGYESLKTAGTINEDTLYFTSDTLKIYKGSALYTGKALVVDALPESPEAGILYVVSGTGIASTWTGSEWKTINATKAGTAHDVTYTAETRTITIPMEGKEDLVINLGKDLVVSSGEYVAATETEPAQIVLTLTNDEVIKIPVADLIDIYTGAETSTAVTTVSADNVITVTVKASAVEGNAITLNEDGLYVSISGKMDKIATPTGGKVVVSGTDGNVVESTATIGGATLAEDASATVLATEAAVKAAVDSVDVTAQITGKMDKIADAAGGKFVMSQADGNVAENADLVVGGATLAETPDEKTLATEAAVDSAVDGAVAALTEDLNDAVDGLTAAKATKLEGATAGTILVASAEGDLAATTTTIGGATLADAPAETTLATEAAVATAITNAALVWQTM